MISNYEYSNVNMWNGKFYSLLIELKISLLINIKDKYNLKLTKIIGTK